MRVSFRWRVAIAYVSLLIVAMGGLGWFFSNYFYQNYLQTVRSQLFSEARLLAEQTAPFLQEKSPYPQLTQLAADEAGELNERITIILPDGKVIYDSAADAAQMENHSNRPEVQKALLGQEDSEIRLSDTLNIREFYAAAPILSGSQVIGVFRLAISLQQIDNRMAVIRQTILLSASVAILVAILLALALSSYTTQPLRQLTNYVVRLGKGKRSESAFSARNDEIGQLEQAFTEMASQLESRIDELQKERSTLTAVLANMTDGILIADRQGNVQLINLAAQRMFSVTEGEALGHSLIEVVRNHQVASLWRKSQSTGEQQTITLETSPDRLLVQGIATPLQQSLPGSILLVFQDLTRVRRLEMVRRDFVSNVSHELRTPLASLKALTETLMEGALEDPPAARRFLTRMEGEIDNLTQMVQELLELSRIESGKVPLERRAISPIELLSPAVERMQLQAERAGLNLSLECPEDLPAVNADPTRVEQVLVNLLHNAIKFTPPGGKISVSAYAEGDNVIIYVKDSGVGIAPDALPRIFERFYKADKARSGGGTGLGLSIARHLVEAHGGRIWAESMVNQGSTFFFSIPLA
jgi:two-component system, OmpR family, phosphate regulon sensor histidine kinase PhoR